MPVKQNESLSIKAPIQTSIAPWLPVKNCEKAVAFYTSALGAKETYRMESPDGQLQVTKLAVDGAEFWLAEQSPDQEDPNINPVPANIFKIILTVTDPDSLFALALKAGAIEVFPVGEEYGWRLGRVVDPFGYHWEIGRPLS